MPARSRRPRPVDSDQQLTLSLAWLSEDEVLGLLRARGLTTLREVRFRPNRSRLISLSADRHRLNLHECFRAAPARVIDAVAAFATAPAGSRSFRDAVEKMREWHEGQVAEYGLSEPVTSCGTPRQQAWLDSVYAELNSSHFRNALPVSLRIRLSDRMSRRFGHVSYARRMEGDRKVAELALNIDLLLPGNERALVDTMLHEMAHVEAWLVHGHRDHGRIWREIAHRVGCEPRACTHMRLKRNRGGDVTAVPVLRLPPAPGDTDSAKPAPAGPRTARSGLKRAARHRA